MRGTISNLAILALLTAALAAGPARAAFVAEAKVDRTSVPVGGEVLLTATAEGDMGWSVDFQLPVLSDVEVTPGGTNQSMSMINGASRTTVSRSWYLRPRTPGMLAIGSLRVTARGETVRTAPLTVTVTPAAAPPADTGNRTPAPPTTAADADLGGDVFVTLAADKSEAWVGEQIILTFRYWRRVQPWNNPGYTAPRTEGFWREDLGPERNLREVHNGRLYSVTEIRYALFPARSGDLAIEPAELTFPDDVFDRFFNSRRRPTGPRVLRTERIVVRVKALPKPAPQGFSGLVANRLSVTTSATPAAVAAGDPVEYRIVLEADGFLKGFAGLQVAAPAGARVHDAAEDLASAPQGDRLVGRLSVEKVLVPSEAGELAVAPVEITWFDAANGRYAVARSQEHRIAVAPGSGTAAGNGDDSGFLRTGLSRLGDDLAFVHAPPRHLRRTGGGFIGSPAWWILLAAPGLLLGAWRVVLDRLAAGRRDPAGRRRRGALAKARRALGEAEVDHAAVGRAVRGYAADVIGCPVAAVDGRALSALAATRGCGPIGEELAAILTACDEARYGGAPVDAVALAKRAQSLVATLDGAVGGAGGPTAAAWALLLLPVLAFGGAPAAAQQATDPARLVAEGNQAYTAGDLGQAVALYSEALSRGADDAVVHYNLGNAHARLGESGRAIAAYLRAAQLDPRDRDIRENLAMVRGRIRDLELTEQQLPPLVAPAVGAVRRLTPDEWSMVLIAACWLLAALVALAWLRGGFGEWLRRCALAVAALLVLAASLTAWRWHAENGVTTAVVVAAESTVRSGPSASLPALFVVHDGLAMRLDGMREGWARVSLGGEWRGWLPREDLVIVGDIPGEAQGR